jgi:hypothetical protein
LFSLAQAKIKDQFFRLFLLRFASKLKEKNFASYRFTNFLFAVTNIPHCCGSGRFLTGSDFRKRPYRDPDPNKFSANFSLIFFYFMNQKVKRHRFLKYIFMTFTHTKKVDTESFIRARIRIRSQTSGSGSIRIRIRITAEPNVYCTSADI